MVHIVSLYEAKTQLSGLVDEAAAGAEIVISKNGIPYAKLVPIAFRGALRRPVQSMKITYIAEEFDAADAGIENLFSGSS